MHPDKVMYYVLDTWNSLILCLKCPKYDIFGATVLYNIEPDLKLLLVHYSVVAL